MNTYKSLITTAMFVCVPLSAVADYSSIVSTPKGTKVSVTVVTADYPSTDKSYWDKAFKLAYPKATLISSSSLKYNCHSYAWYSQSSSNNVWMNDPTKYWADGSYAGYCMSTPPSGYKVYYPSNTPDNSHSAISLGGGLAQSKWGKGPLMKHALNYGPAVYQMGCYYSYRR